MIVPIPLAAQARAGGIRLIELILGGPRGIITIGWGRFPARRNDRHVISFFSIERGDIPAMQNFAEYGPRPMLNGILFNQLLDARGNSWRF